MAAPVITHNSPAAGSIAWTETNIQYNGQSFVVPAGSTDKRFVWWKYNLGAPTIHYGNTLPDGNSTFADNFSTDPIASGAVVGPTTYSYDSTGLFLRASTTGATTSMLARYAKSSRVTKLAFECDIEILSDAGGNRRHAGFFLQTVDTAAFTGIRVVALDDKWVVSTYSNGTENTASRVTSSVVPKPLAVGVVRRCMVYHDFFTGDGYVQVDGDTVFSYNLKFGVGGRPGFFGYGATIRFDNAKGIPTPDALTIDDTLLFINKEGIGADATRTSVVEGSLIVGGSILADAIAANQITSYHILAGSIDASDIRANTITSNQIKAGSILTADLAISDTYNYIANPFLNHPTALEFWSFTGTGWQEAVSSSTGINRYLGKIGGTAGNAVNDSIIECRQGETLEVTATTYHVSEASVQIGVFWLNADLTAVLAEDVAADPVTSNWTEFRKTFVAPANVGGAVFAVKHLNTSGTVRVANPRFVRRFAGRLIVDGTITADQLAANSVTATKILAGVVDTTHLAANSVTAAQIAANAVTADEIAANAVYAAAIQANAVTADKIAANAVTADEIAANAVYAGAIQTNAVTADKIAANAITAAKLDADAINGKTITGATIRTSASMANGGVEIDVDGLRSYYNDGAIAFELTNGTASGDGAMALYGEEHRILYGGALTAHSDFFGNDGVYTSMEGGALRTGTWKPSLGTLDSLRKTYPEIRTTPTEVRAALSASIAAQFGVRSSDNAGYLDANKGFSIRGQDGTVSVTQQGTANNATLSLTSDGPLVLGTAGQTGVVASQKIRDSTTSSAGNVYINPTSGLLYRNSSSRRYKTDIQEWDAATVIDRLLNLKPKTWIDRAEKERWESGDEFELTPPRRHFGLIAEETDEAGLWEITGYNDEWLPEDISYSLVGPMLIPVIKGLCVDRGTQAGKISTLEAEVASLKEQVASLLGGSDV